MPQNVSNGFNASIGVSVFFFWVPKPILRPIWGPFWPESAEGAKFRGEKMPKSGTLGNRPRGHPMALPWPVVASTVLLGTQRTPRVGEWSVGVRARGLSHPLLAGWGGLGLNLAQNPKTTPNSSPPSPRCTLGSAVFHQFFLRNGSN